MKQKKKNVIHSIFLYLNQIFNLFTNKDYYKKKNPTQENIKSYLITPHSPDKQIEYILNKIKEKSNIRNMIANRFQQETVWKALLKEYKLLEKKLNITIIDI